jgi:hypothetical protein
MLLGLRIMTPDPGGTRFYTYRLPKLSNYRFTKLSNSPFLEPAMKAETSAAV